MININININIIIIIIIIIVIITSVGTWCSSKYVWYLVSGIWVYLR